MAVFVLQDGVDSRLGAMTDSLHPRPQSPRPLPRGSRSPHAGTFPLGDTLFVPWQRTGKLNCRSV